MILGIFCPFASDSNLLSQEHFNHIIREYGIQAVNVKEALGLDDELMSYIP